LRSCPNCKSRTRGKILDGEGFYGEYFMDVCYDCGYRFKETKVMKSEIFFRQLKEEFGR